MASTSGAGVAKVGGFRKGGSTAWAVQGTVKNLAREFDKLRPSMAHQFPFELDTFQKEAVLHLEMVSFNMIAKIQLICP